MNELFTTLKGIFDGSQKRQTLMLALNAVLCFTICSIFFKIIHVTGLLPANFEWTTIVDYLSAGHYALYLLCLYIFWKVTRGIPSLLFFNWYELIIAKKDRAAIYNTSVENYEINAVVRNLNILGKKFAGVQIQRSTFFEYWLQLKQLLTPAAFEAIRKSCDETLKDIKAEVVTASRLLLAIIISFAYSPFYPVALFVFLIIVILLYITIRLFLYRLMDQLPVILHKLCIEGERLLMGGAGNSLVGG